jgi:hypothetical protein
MSTSDYEVVHVRRVVEGKTLNTETAQLIAAGMWDTIEADGTEGTANLYLSRQGQFFEVMKITRYWYDRDKEEQRARTVIDATPLDDATARKWPGIYSAEIVNDVFSLLDEEGRQATEETLLLRMPSDIKALLKRKAEAASISMNEYVLRLVKLGVMAEVDAKERKKKRGSKTVP